MALVHVNHPHGVEYYAHLYPNYYNRFKNAVIQYAAESAVNATRDVAIRNSENHRVASSLYGASKYRPRGYSDGRSSNPPPAIGPPTPAQDGPSNMEIDDTRGVKRKISFPEMKISAKKARELKFGKKGAWKKLMNSVYRHNKKGKKGPVFGYKRKRRTRFRKKRQTINGMRWSCIERLETGSSINDVECVYLGHGVANNRVMQDILAALFVEGARMNGIECQSFTEDRLVQPEDTANTHQITVVYLRDEKEQQAQNFQFNLAVGDTCADAATKMLTAMATTFGALTDLQKPKLINIRYVKFNTVTTGERQVVFQVNLQYTKFVVDYTSYIKWQNITKPGLVAALTGTDPTSIGNVEAVTLHGRKYTFGEWSNQVELNKRGNAAAGTNNGIIVNPSNGIVKTGSAAIGAPTGQFQKPPYAYEVNAKKAEKVIVPSGQIYRDKLSFKSTMYLNKYLDIFLDAIRVNTIAGYESKMNYGMIHLFALEKMLDFRAGTDHPIEVGFEVDATIKVGVTYKRPPAKATVTTQVVV